MLRNTKNQPLNSKKYLILIVLGLTSLAHSEAWAMAKKPKEKEAEIQTPAPAPTELNTLAEKTLQALKTKDGAALSKLVDPKRGVRFVPYGTYSKEDVIFLPKDVEGMFKSKKRLTWGAFDGSGEPIVMTPTEYYQRFIWNADYTTAKEVNWNTTKGVGNALDNQKQFFPNAQTIEYYFPGFDKKYAGIDWSALRLVFDQGESKNWYLVAIVHNQHTM